MASKLRNWVEQEVEPLRGRPVSWLSQFHFFRDPIRPTYSDLGYFFSPADGVVVYQKTVDPDDPIVDIKGSAYSLKDALRDPLAAQPSLVIGIFMTFFDVHVNRIPFPGRLSYRELDPVDSYNHPMLDVEKGIFDDLRIPTEAMDYLRHNQRVVNRIYSPDLGFSYFILQVADYDVDCITPFVLKQNQSFAQGERFSQVRYGSQVDLVVPLSSRFEFELLQATTTHVEAGVDPLIRVAAKTSPGRRREG